MEKQTAPRFLGASQAKERSLWVAAPQTRGSSGCLVMPVMQTENHSRTNKEISKETKESTFILMHPSCILILMLLNEWPPSLPMRHLGLIALLPGHLSGRAASQGNFNRCTCPTSSTSTHSFHFTALPPWFISYHWQGSLGLI